MKKNPTVFSPFTQAKWCSSGHLALCLLFLFRIRLPGVAPVSYPETQESSRTTSEESHKDHAAWFVFIIAAQERTYYWAWAGHTLWSTRVPYSYLSFMHLCLINHDKFPALHYNSILLVFKTASNFLNQTDSRADTTAKGFIWANISTSTTSLLQGQSYKQVTSKLQVTSYKLFLFFSKAAIVPKDLETVFYQTQWYW